MCLEAICQNDRCGKRTWWGCGGHIVSVMDKIPEEEQCKCDDTPGSGGARPAKPANAPAGKVDVHYKGAQA